MATTFPNKEFRDFGDYSIDLTDGTLTRAGDPVHLAPIVMRILLILTETPGRLVTKEELKKAAWPPDLVAVSDGTLHQKIRELRKTLGDRNGNGEGYIENTPTRGYRFVAPVTVRYVDDAVERQAAPPAPQPVEPQPAGIWSRYSTAMAVTIMALGLVCGTVYIGATLHDSFDSPRIEEYRRITYDGNEKLGPLLNDGSRIYFEQRRGLGWQREYTSIDGSDTIALKPPFGDRGAMDTLNPRTGEILFIGDDESWLWSPGRSWARRLEVKGISHGDFSPDGRTLALSRLDPPELDFYDSNSLAKLGIQIELPRQTVQRFSIRYSPAGDAIRLSLVDQRLWTNSIWEVSNWKASPRTGSPRRVFPSVQNAAATPANACCGVWGPGGWFVYSSLAPDAGDNRGDLWAVHESPAWFGREFGRWIGKPGHSEPRPLKSAISFSWPAVDADGQTILAIGNSLESKAVRFDLQTKELSPFLGGAPVAGLSSSRSGDWIAYIDPERNTIWKSKPDGGNRVQLTFPPMEAYQPHWSPDGKQIAFMGRMPGGHWRAYRVSSLGGQPEVISETATEQGVPTWSADGCCVAFGDRHEALSGARMTIHLWDFRTRRLSNLPGSLNRWTARWSPNGRYIAAQSENWHELYLFDTSKQTWERIGVYYATDDLNWSPDGAYLYFMATIAPGEGRDCYRIRIADRKTEEILGHAQHPDLGAHIVGIAPDGSPVFERPVTEEDIYALKVKWP